MDWSNRVVFVTGAGSGIGAALAEEMADQGASVALMDVDPDGLEEVSQSLSGEASNHITVKGDVTDTSDIEEAFDRTRDELGSPDLVVANAGLGYTTSADDLRVDEFKTLTDVNYMGVVNTVSEGLESMKENGRGHIAITSSVAAFTSFKGGAAYCASKVAVLRLAESFRQDLAQEPISVTTIHPGWVSTPMTEKYSERLRMNEVSADRAAEIIREGIENEKRRVIFPWSFKVLVKIMSVLPYGLLDFIQEKLPHPEALEKT